MKMRVAVESGEWRVEIGEQQSSKEAREERERVDEE